MATDRKFFELVYEVKVLCDDEDTFKALQNCNLEIIAREISTGDCSGSVKLKDANALGGYETAKALIEQGSGTEFFNLDGDGNDLD